ncbi:conserved domain protein [Listeria monocytogenes FSL F2-208]|nr:conserved domain protein [Listeria monocytogenes FSL F2-208]
MRLYSFNDFRYICYLEGKDKAIEKLFAELYETRKLKALQRRIKKNEMDLKTIYDEYLQHQSIVNN